MLVVVQGEAGEGGLAGDERRGGGDLPPEIAGSLPAEGDGRRGDADAAEAGPARRSGQVGACVNDGGDKGPGRAAANSSWTR